jgi:hypothetical protein
VKTRVAKLAFNRGLVSRLGLARADIKRLAMAAEIQTNWVSRTLGSMMLRPGTEFLGDSQNDNKAKHIGFVFSVADKALIELTDQTMRVWIRDVLVARPAVSTVVANGNFDVDLSNWTDNDEAGATSAWVAGGYMGLTGNGSAAAIRDQQINVAAADSNVEHALHIIIQRGPLMLRVGTAVGLDDLISETELATGVHSLAFTPVAGPVWIRFFSRLERITLVDSCQIEAAGVMMISAPWLEADLDNIRHDASADVIFIATDGYQQRRIERRSARSWSVVRYYTNDGPYITENIGPITMTPGALSGNSQLIASAAYFKSTNVGSLFRLSSDGQSVNVSVTAANQFSGPIRVEGVTSQRIFSLSIATAPPGAATITLQRSLVGPTGPWTDVASYGADTTTTFNDGLDNQIAWYRIGCKLGDYTGGTHSCTLDYTVGSITGVCRVTAFTSSVNVDIEIITDFGGTAPVLNWAEGKWSDRRGYPTAVGFHEGRLGWAGRDSVQLSVSDAFDSFDPETIGDSAPMDRSIGSGPVDNINWMLSLQRLILGAQMSEFSVRSSSLDEPLTPTNFNIKAASTQGSSPVQAVKIDQRGIYIQRGGVRVYELAFGQSYIDYESTHLSALIPEIGEPGIVRMAVQRQPDTRVHFVRSDGTVAVLIFDPLEQVLCWLEIETDGLVEDAVVLPGDAGDEEDFVYYSVKRTINGATKRYLETWAFESEARGDQQLCMLGDSFIAYSGVPQNVIAAGHLIGENVTVWADGKDVGTQADGSQLYTVDGAGNVTLANAAANVVIGLPYSASWKSAKLVELMENPQGMLTDQQQIRGLGLILADVHAKGLKYGHDLVEANMRDLPMVTASGPVDPDAVRQDYTEETMAFPGEWSTDARLCLLAKAPRPCTVLAALAELEHHE